jgi:hypothetical protein
MLRLQAGTFGVEAMTEQQGSIQTLETGSGIIYGRTDQILLGTRITAFA